MKNQNPILYTPILFLVFNRPKVTRKVFEMIRKVQPRFLYIAADGPRADKENEGTKCEEVRAIVNEIDWDCQVRTLFRASNLGCRNAVSGGISWFFEHEEKGIILEDDCMPAESFFYYCQEVLDKYQDDTRITHINGNNFHAPRTMASQYSYHFTYIPQVWGWATWRRAWKRYDVNMHQHTLFDHHLYFKHCGLTKSDYKKIGRRWAGARVGKIDTWDYQWHFVNMLEGSLVISPVKNQISNLGFSGEATHSPNVNMLKENLPTFELSLPLHHPPCLFVDEKLNKHFKDMMINEPLAMKLKRKLLKQRIKLFR